MFPLFESIKVEEGQLCNLYWHQQRVDRSLGQLYGNGITLDLSSGIKVPEQFNKGVVKCRVSYGKSLGPVTFSSYTRKPVRSLQLVECEQLEYGLKYQDRSKLQSLYGLRGACDDILITQGSKLTDTSYSNVALFDGDNWYTPEKPLLAGTQRARLLSKGMLRTASIHLDQLGNFEKLVLINAMLDFDPDRYLLIEDLINWKD